MNTFKDQAPTVSGLREVDERLYGANPDLDADLDLNVNRFASTDNYTPHDVTKNPAAIYAFEQGFDDLFPASLLTSGKLGQLAVGGSAIVSSPEQAEAATAQIVDPNQRDHARSSIALHYLYGTREDRLEKAEDVLATIEDLGFATHVLAQIVRASEKHVVTLEEAHRYEIEEALRQKAGALAAQHDAHLADILDEAAEALHDPELHEQAIVTGETHINAPLTPSPTPKRTINKANEGDGAVKIDMSAYL